MLRGSQPSPWPALLGPSPQGHLSRVASALCSPLPIPGSPGLLFLPLPHTTQTHPRLSAVASVQALTPGHCTCLPLMGPCRPASAGVRLTGDRGPDQAAIQLPTPLPT